MFYCEPCRVKNGWPDPIMKSIGPCELCGKHALCHDMPSSQLPLPKPKMKNKKAKRK